MKTARKIFAAVIAVALVFAFCLTAFAADGKGSITIINPKADATYTAVKIFDVTYSGDNYSYTIKSTDVAYPKVSAYAARSDSGLTLTLNGDVYVATVDDTFSAAAFAAYLKGYSAELGTGTAFVKTERLRPPILISVTISSPAQAVLFANSQQLRISLSTIRTKVRKSTRP